MRPITLTLTGFLGIRAGMGRETVTLDLDSLAGDAAMVALAGPNGAGKTTLLDNLHPYRMMPSRASDLSVGSFSFYDHVGAAAEKALRFEHKGKTFDAILKMKQTAKTRKTEAYLLEVTAAGAVPAKAADGTESDGKVDTFDRCLTSVLGSPSLYFSAAFSAQGRRGLAKYKASETKELLTELLDLERYAVMAEKARQVAALIAVPLPGLRQDALRIEQQTADMQAAEARHAEATVKLKAATDARAKARKEAADAGKAIAEAQAAEGLTRDLRRRRDDLQRQLEQIKTQRARAIASADATLIDATTRADADIAKLTAQITLAEASVDQAIADHAALMATLDARAEATRTAEIQIVSARALVEATETALEKAKAAAEDRSEQAKAIAVLDADLGRILNDGKALSREVDGCRLRGKLAREVPCAGTDMQPRCPLLSDAVSANVALPDLEAKLKTARQAYTDESARKAALIEALAPAVDLRAIEVDLSAHRKTVSIMENAIAAGQSAEEERARATAQQLQRIEQLREQMGQASESLMAARQWKTDAQTKAAAEKTAIEAETAGQIAAVESELREIAVDDTLSAVAHAESEAAKAEAALAAVEATCAALQAEIAREAATIEVLRSGIGDRDAIAHRLSDLEAKHSNWVLLSKGLGRNGIIALSIDDAGPTLSTITNDLLASCFGDRFAVQLVTQTEKRDGEQKETMDIIVFDAHRGDSRPLRAMSGGEQVFINETLSRALALYQAAGSAGLYHTLLTDETDGALDQDKKLQYAGMKRRVLELGGFRREIFISHSPAIIEAADAVIDVRSL
ncbi:MAG: hypothetical protein EOM91_18430 [Sphingobacteriia bacterium]|nr:hypothetical protein [Sphingobacteriia bacterium]